jgi:hypothetical protein
MKAELGIRDLILIEVVIRGNGHVAVQVGKIWLDFCTVEIVFN